MIKYSVSKQIIGIQREALKTEVLNYRTSATEGNAIIFKHCNLYRGTETKRDKLVSSAIHGAAWHNNLQLTKISSIFNC